MYMGWFQPVSDFECSLITVIYQMWRPWHAGRGGAVKNP